MSTGYGWEGIRQVCETLLDARHVPERLCGGARLQRGAITSVRPLPQPGEVYLLIIQGERPLPSKAEMWSDIQQLKEKMSRRFVQTQRHKIQVDYVPYMLELAKLAGNYPDICMYRPICSV